MLRNLCSDVESRDTVCRQVPVPADEDGADDRDQRARDLRRDELQPELKILESFRAQIAHRLLLLQRFIHQHLRRRRREADFDPVKFLEPVRKFLHHLPRDNMLLTLRIGENLLQFRSRIFHQLRRDDKTFHRRGRQLKFDFAKHALAHRHQATRPRLFVARALRDAPQAFVRKQYFNPICRKVLLVLADDAALGTF